MRKGIVISLVILTATIAIVRAIPQNWFEGAQFSGIIVKAESGVIKATIDLGSLPSATRFSESGNATLTVAVPEGLNISRLLLRFPYYTPEEGNMYVQYLTARFSELTIDLTVGDLKNFSNAIVTNGNWPGQWSLMFYESTYSYYQSWYWGSVSLPQGVYTVTFTIHGKSGIVTQSRTVDLMFYLELTA
jgi:hypothetical protein